MFGYIVETLTEVLKSRLLGNSTSAQRAEQIALRGFLLGKGMITSICIASFHVFLVTLAHVTILKKGASSLPIIPLLKMILRTFIIP